MIVYPTALGVHPANLTYVASLVVLVWCYALTWNFILGLGTMWVAIDSYMAYKNQVDLTVAYVLCNQLLFKSILIATATRVRYPHSLLRLSGSGVFFYVWVVPDKTMMVLLLDNTIVSLIVLLVGLGLRRGKVCCIGNALFLLNIVMVYELQHKTPVVLYKSLVNTCIILAASCGYKILTNKMYTAEPFPMHDYEMAVRETPEEEL